MRKSFPVIFAVCVLILFSSLGSFGQSGGARSSKGARLDPAGQCAETLSALPIAEFLKLAAPCHPSTFLGKAAFFLTAMESAYPGLLKALRSYGVRLQVSKAPPIPIPEEYKGAYLPDQNILWARASSSEWIAYEIFHVVDFMALPLSGLKPDPEQRRILEEKYGKDTPLFYGYTLTTTDPYFYELWDGYVRRNEGKYSDPECGDLGCQGIENAHELIMEVGIVHFLEKSESRKGRKLLSEKRKKIRPGILKDYTDLSAYFLTMIASVTTPKD